MAGERAYIIGGERLSGWDSADVTCNYHEHTKITQIGHRTLWRAHVPTAKYILVLPVKSGAHP